MVPHLLMRLADAGDEYDFDEKVSLEVLFLLFSFCDIVCVSSACLQPSGGSTRTVG